jgi:hypothetical protein
MSAFRGGQAGYAGGSWSRGYSWHHGGGRRVVVVGAFDGQSNNNATDSKNQVPHDPQRRKRIATVVGFVATERTPPSGRLSRVFHNTSKVHRAAANRMINGCV